MTYFGGIVVSGFQVVGVSNKAPAPAVKAMAKAPKSDAGGRLIYFQATGLLSLLLITS
jgi:hypothetical protein